MLQIAYTKHEFLALNTYFSSFKKSDTKIYNQIRKFIYDLINVWVILSTDLIAGITKKLNLGLV